MTEDKNDKEIKYHDDSSASIDDIQKFVQAAKNRKPYIRSDDLGTWTTASELPHFDTDELYPTEER